MTMQNQISASEFSDLLKRDNNGSKNSIKILDVRTPAEIHSERLPNSIHLPLQELTLASFQASTANQDISTDDTIYILCGSGIRAEKARQLMDESTTQKLLVIEGGINALKQQPVTIIKQSGGVPSLERQVRIAAGSLVLLGILLAMVNPLFLFLSAFVGAGLVFAGVTDNCGMALLLTRMPWNQTNLPFQQGN